MREEKKRVNHILKKMRKEKNEVWEEKNKNRMNDKRPRECVKEEKNELICFL